ncbi:hypothetical protein EBB04_32810 [Sinorhizobium meliloti]|nr:hypothetical protein EBB04_32810 [Sinorhizobium meliloti]
MPSSALCAGRPVTVWATARRTIWLAPKARQNPRRELLHQGFRWKVPTSTTRLMVRRFLPRQVNVDHHINADDFTMQALSAVLRKRRGPVR